MLSPQVRARAELELRARAHSRIECDPKLTAARNNLLSFATYTKPDYETNWHHRVLCQYLEKFVTGEIKRLMVLMPPRHGKSELVSRRLPAYILGKNPQAQLIACSYSADLASAMNRDVQRIIDSDEYLRLFPDTRLFGANVRTVVRGSYLRNSDVFEVVGHRGRYKSAGVGGPITGYGFDRGIIDDPIKNREEAESQVQRDALWDWYTSTFYTRKEKGAGILLTYTPWHQDDLGGRILASEEAPEWTVVRFPAVAEGDNEAIGDERKEGEALWPNKYDEKALEGIRAAIGTYQWNGMYQQRPQARDGGMFKRGWFDIVDAVPAIAERVRYWDNAGTDGDGDYTAGVLMARTNEGQYFVEDVVRGQWSAMERESVKRQTASLDAQKYGNRVHIWTEQEPGSGGKDSAQATIRGLEGYTVRAERVSGEKTVRAEPFAAQCEARNVKLIRGDWNAAYLNELCAFPMGMNDDQVDASASGFNKLAIPTKPRNYGKVYR